MFQPGKLASAIALAGIFSLTGCGGGSSSSSSSSSPSSFNLAGVAIKGVMIGADITVYDLDSGDELYTTTTDSQGRYTLSGLVTDAEILKIVMTTNANTTTKCDSAVGCESGTYAFGETYAFNDPDFILTALLANPGSSDASMAVTPLTHMATKRAEDEGVTTGTEISAINNATAALFGLTGVDITTVEPTDITTNDSATASSGSVKYAAVLAGFATAAEKKGKSITAAVNDVTSAYVANDGLSGKSSDDDDIDLEDLFAGAVDAVNKAEETLDIDIDDATEVGLVAKEQEMANATPDENVAADPDNIPEETELTDLDKATIKGIALLETMNDWNDTLVSVGEQVAGTESALSENADHLGDTADAVADYADSVAESQTVALDAVALLTGFVDLSLFINEYMEELQPSYNEETGVYSLTLTPANLGPVLVVQEAEIDFPFFYGEFLYPVETAGTLDVTFEMNGALGEITEISYVGTSSTFTVGEETSAALTLNSLTMALDYSVSPGDNTGSVSITDLDLDMPSGVTMTGAISSVPTSLTGSGSITGTLDNLAILDGASEWSEDYVSPYDVNASATVLLDLSLTEDTEESPASGTIGLELTAANSTEAGASMAVQLALNLSNGAGSSIQGTIVGDYSDAAPEDADMTFTGTITSMVTDEGSELNGASTSFEGSLGFSGVTVSDDETLRSVTVALNGSVDIEAADGATISFSGNASLTAESFATASGSTWYEYLYYYQWDDEYYDTELEEWVEYTEYMEFAFPRFVPTQASLSGTLSTSLATGETASAGLSATLLIEDLDTVIAGLDQIDGGKEFGEFDVMVSYEASYDTQENTASYAITNLSYDDIVDGIDALLEDANISLEYIYEESYWRTVESGLQLVSGECYQDQDTTNWFCPVYLNYSDTADYYSDDSGDDIDEDSDSYLIGELELSNTDYEADVHLAPAQWTPMALAQGLGEELHWTQYVIDLASLDGYLLIKGESLSDVTDITPLTLIVTGVDLEPDPFEQIANLETETSFVDASVQVSMDLNVWGYDDASIQLTLARNGLESGTASLALMYGNRAVTIVGQVEDSLVSGSSDITITDGDATMVITATCLSDTEDTSLDTCDSADLDFSGVITVDDQEVGTLEVRDELPVFVFGDRGSYEVVTTPSFLVSRQ